MGAIATPKQILQQVAADLVTGLSAFNVRPGQVIVAMHRYGQWQTSPAGWSNPIFLVIPGQVRPDGSGGGAQEGGNLYRRVYVTIVINHGALITAKDQNSSVLTSQKSILDFAEAIIAEFRYVYLGGLLIEPMTYEGETDIIPESNNPTTFRKEITFSCLINTPLPDVADLTQ